MKKIKIMTDSTSDLSEELLKQYDISVIPLHVNLGENEYLDGVNVTPEEIYRWSDEHKETPKTSAISMFEAKEAIQKALEEAEKVICFCISSEMSGCRSVLCMTTDEMEVSDRVFVIDSRNLSTGIGLQIMETVRLVKEGMEAEQIVEKIKEMQPLVRSSFVVDTLTYLHRGGRCTGLAAMAGGAMKLHPCIWVRDGEMKAGKKYRGRMDKVVTEYVKDLMPLLENAKKDMLFITHSGCDEEMINTVKAEIEVLCNFNNIYVTRAGSIISSHCGPGTLGVLFVEAEK